MHIKKFPRIPRRPQTYNLSWPYRTFGMHWPTERLPKAAIIKLLKFLAPILLIMAAYAVVAIIDSKANLEAAEYHTKAQSLIDAEKAKTKKVEELFTICLNGGVFILDDKTSIDCRRTKTRNAEKTKIMQAEEKKFQDSLALSAN